jgi:sugar phosphate isomerase/epimerase
VNVRIGLSAYSLPWRCGWVGAGTERVCATPYTVDDLLMLTAEFGLSSIEFPLLMLPDLEAETLQAVRERAASLNLTIVADSGVVDVPTLERYIPAAAALGARTLRVMLSTILEGARATVPGGWDAYLDEIIARLKALRPLAEAHNVCLAPENHQDATSADLVRLCEAVGGDCIGVTLDAVNPLAVGEHPLEFARVLGPRIVNVHLKDYRIHLTPSGYRLARCMLGEGVLDIPALFVLLAEIAPHAIYHIELAALQARHIRLFENDWWNGYGPRDIRDLLPTLRLVAQHACPPDEDWRTPWERGEDEQALLKYERRQVRRSVKYLRGLR